ncbi:Uncharacterised protein [Vibrio cholerae]|nr:Uncharacterised protein [Vibrio cholerae]CSI18524.1 Uncharacterised protein [Vibrio cholerae]
MTSRCVDTCNPQLTELTFLSATVTVSVLTSFNNCLERYTINT